MDRINRIFRINRINTANTQDRGTVLMGLSNIPPGAHQWIP
jgi:hypothetical protein